MYLDRRRRPARAYIFPKRRKSITNVLSVPRLNKVQDILLSQRGQNEKTDFEIRDATLPFVC